MLSKTLTAEVALSNEGGYDLDRTDYSLSVSVRNVGKVYYLYDRPQDRLKQAFLWGRKKLYREFWALRNVSFDVGRGEALGIVGHNGAGKSTLLQILAGTLPPTTGEVRINGRVAAMLELASGFNSQFTGRENIYLKGAILGFSRQEMDELLGEILAFADIGDFIDQPVKLYSSGMSVRLAFAVHACVKPSVLIVDEALSVGDIGFRRKCYRHMEKLRKEGTTIILVTHSMGEVINFCDRAMLLSKGENVRIGSPKLITNLYYKQMFKESIVTPLEDYGDGQASIDEIWFEDVSGKRITSVAIGKPFSFCYYVDFHNEISNPVFGMSVKTIQGQLLVGSNTFLQGRIFQRFKKGDKVKVRWYIDNKFNFDRYFFSCSCLHGDTNRFACRKLDAVMLAVVGASKEGGIFAALSGVDVQLMNKPG